MVFMASVLIQKNGSIIRVNSESVDAHQALGWATLENSYGADVLQIPPSGSIQFIYGEGATVESLAVQHYQILPAANSATAVHAAITLGADAQNVTTGITNPDVPRTVTVKGNVSGIVGDVIITGRNILGELITDTIALNGTGEVEGAVAFATVESITLPAETHTPTAQVETATAAGTITLSGNAKVIVTAAGMSGTPKTISVAVLNGDTADVWAAKVRAALLADAAVTALYTPGGLDDKIVLTRKINAANDASLNINLNNDTCTGITPAASSENTTAGVGYDTVSVGQAKKFGLPQIVYNAACVLVKLFKGSADLGTLAVDADYVEKNLFSLAGTPDGGAVDLYYLA
jgi:hypothetical protein